MVYWYSCMLNIAEVLSTKKFVENKRMVMKMSDANAEKIKSALLQGEFGLEMEGLRVNRSGFLSHTPHPLKKQSHIVRDFCENQIEINTGVEKSAKDAVQALGNYYKEIQAVLSQLPEPEYLWPFSNPPYIKDEKDIPIAEFVGEEREKTEYRKYLSERYGRYKMALSGIHVNYSFSETFLKLQYGQYGTGDYKEYKNQFYLQLAQNILKYSWLIVVLTAASPVLDSSFVEKGVWGKDLFLGLSSVRCSELGYWNSFTPVFSYQNLDAYIESLQWYIEKDWIQSPSELYYPVRVKPKGENSLENLKQNGINHIELRMFDVNPLAEFGVNDKDVEFVQLMMGWLASLPMEKLSDVDQIQAIQNIKNAAHFDLKTVNIYTDGKMLSMVDAALQVLEQMKRYYEYFPDKENIQRVLEYEEEKCRDAFKRYAWIIREQYENDYVGKGLKLAAVKQNIQSKNE